MINEIWKDIEGYEGLYQVSNFGRVRSLNYNHTGQSRILKPGKYRNGYYMVVLYKDRKQKSIHVHKLVTKAFVDGWFPGAWINHKNHVRTDNSVENLEWVTAKENSSREKSFGPALNSKKICQFTKDGTFVKEWQSAAEVEMQLGFSHGNISQCCSGKRYKSVGGFVWRFR